MRGERGDGVRDGRVRATRKNTPRKQQLFVAWCRRKKGVTRGLATDLMARLPSQLCRKFRLGAGNTTTIRRCGPLRQPYTIVVVLDIYRHENARAKQRARHDVFFERRANTYVGQTRPACIDSDSFWLVNP